MTSSEIRAGLSLASIFALRMLGLFMMLPIFVLHAKSLADGSSDSLIGMALGIYGITQACLQLPFGIASDKYGRKPVIVFGLILFVLGAVIAALSHTVMGLLIGRAIQGSGAISAAITALLADTTREQHRTKAMAMVGGSIGMSFALAMVLAPVLYLSINMSGIFWMIASMALAAIGVVLWVTPNAPKIVAPKVPLTEVLKNPELMRLNFGVFVLHLSQVAMFVVLPTALVQVAHIALDHHWQVYLPVMFVSFIVMVMLIMRGERGGKMKQVFVWSIALLMVAQLGFWALFDHAYTIIASLFIFFVAFNTLEASQPSLVSRLAPPAAKGAALGVYNTLQALGLATGGALGGWMKQHTGTTSIFIFTAVLSLIWLIIAVRMPEIAKRGGSQ
ncbi:MFS transporter [Undibacterium cyanobacteriorum]|uniref:MFS transporter n=1 Tax=Undibacterium cyanobacteriorum TaxID=3073561 RepID=A0ABY9RQQ4_9BURK|nr:MFS transporter [Undibacterium sp. 20NA77.5]WMW82570.1 MFS transporter [Undibacterium sp. 20NA77.5]